MQDVACSIHNETRPQQRLRLSDIYTRSMDNETDWSTLATCFLCVFEPSKNKSNSYMAAPLVAANSNVAYISSMIMLSFQYDLL